MDLQSLYDLTQHFAHAIQAFSPLVHEVTHSGSDLVRNVVTAFTDKDAMSLSDRFFHAGKLGVLTTGLALTLSSGQFLEAAGLAIADREEVLKLDRIGAKSRLNHNL